MSRPVDRQTEYTKWAASRPGVPGDPGTRRKFRNPLHRPVLTLFGLLAFAVVLGGGAWAMFGSGGPEVSADHDAVLATLDLEGGICCIEHTSINGTGYLVVVAEERPGLFIRESRETTMRVIQITDDGLDEISSLQTPWRTRLPWSLTTDNGTAYVPLVSPDGSESGIWMLDISDPSDPDELGVVGTDSGVTSLFAGGDDLLAAHISGEFRFYDTSDPGQPRLIGSFRQPVSSVQRMILDRKAGRLYDREVRGNRIRISDISDLERPSPFGRHLNEAGASSAPHRPGNVIGGAAERLEQTAPGQQFQDFSVSGETMYVAASDSGLEIVDVSDATAPELIDRITFNGRVVRIDIAENDLHVVTVNEESRERLAYEVHTFDLVEADRPELLSTVDDIRAAPGRQVIETGGRYVFLGLSDTIVMIDSER
jgi:hypothetical protein